jgi:heme-degrading monooxygenase HmoA
MIYEQASLNIDPAHAVDFEAAVARALPYFEAATGFMSFSLQKSIENAGKYILIVGWESVEAHMVDFRNSDGFQSWRNLVGDFFVAPPSVEHTKTVI